MIFDVSPSQIECLESKQLVELLKKLLHTEAQCSGISLGGVSVPLQITVSDGGEDARISWVGGLEQTDYLPSRFCIFQSKATDPKPAGWKKEVWTKSSQKNGNTRTLNEAVTKAIAENGSYIGFTSAVLIGSKYDERIEGIKQGIREAGADPAQLKAIEIYDANKIADWVSRYPAIAVWLNEKQSDLTFKGFQTIERLGRKSDILPISQVEDKANRFLIAGKNNSSQANNDSSGENSLTFSKVKERISDYLADSKTSIRILGSSGVGKTRFVYEIFRDETTTAKMALATSTIYCDFRDIGRQIFQIVQSLSEAGSSALMIVDECPRETAIKLCEIVTTEGSKLRLLTIGNDNQPIEKDNCLNISVAPADDALIDGIIQQRYPKADCSDVRFIRKLSGGYPRIAVLATNNYSEGAHILKSVEDVVERILVGCGIDQVEQVRAIECLALFKQLGADESCSDEIDFVAEILARQTGDEMYEHLAHAAKQHLVDHRGYYFAVQPLPIAAFLGTRRLDLLRVKTVLNFIESAPPALRASFLSQLRHFDGSKTAFTVTQRLLARDGLCGSLEKLETQIGSECLAAIVHIDPDGVAEIIRYTYGKLSTDELKEVVTGKRNLVQVLEILVFRKNSFHVAASLLMQLAAIEHGTYISDASERFKQLFQLQLSGTEAEPSDRFAILDQGLLSGDEKIILVCIEALERTLKRDYFVWDRGAELIGNQPPLKAWNPKIWGEIFDFYKHGLQRLASVRVNHRKFAGRCEKIIASHIRSLLLENLFGDIESIVKKIATEKGIWLEVIEGIGDWLYFDRTKVPESFSQKVRQLYDDLIPTDPIERALLYTKFWTGDICDPDLSYDRDDRSNQDFEYSSRKAKEIAAEIAEDKQLSYRAIQIMVREELNNVFPFTEELATKLEDPVEAFQIAVTEFEKSAEKRGLQFLRGLLAGIDRRSSEYASKCIQIALESNALNNQMVNIYTAVNISVDRLNEITQSIRQGSIPAAVCAYFSYSRGLDHLEAKDILPLIDELTSNHGSEGIWVSLEIILMYQLNRATLDEQLANQIRYLITSQELLESRETGVRDGHLFEQLILLVQKHYGIDDQFALELSSQIVKLCQVENYQAFSTLDSYCRNVIQLLVQEKPELLWKTLSRFFEIATPSETHYLKALVGPLENTFDGESHNKEGILFGISEAELVDWAKASQELRAPFLCIFYPVIEVNEERNSQWHPALERLSRHFGAVEEFRHSLEQRLYPSTWSGSIVPSLEAYLTPLQAWFSHPVPEMSFWARDIYRSLEREISRERS
ncbi:hypothetical protein K9N68_39015 (plasmid) [Kovacikia minuta CCNUW1]|uniref:hypothetical protein n=1 Tax=Kovacikia minuta TaxID=2931930 RepID=UPI001CCA2F6B|nr:hypothetical protein [Kovacikia minuta]UBF30137.1 hypothetical protein K9N68_39015 [Kovacikia minuta CCNUW1]